VDDINEWNFMGNNDTIHSPGTASNEQHGTHITGIIPAVKDNGVGIAGIAPKAKIMPLKVFSNGQVYTIDLIEGINYAANGAKVVNCSWGTAEQNTALMETMKGSSMLFVCAVGNCRENIDSTPVYPASYSSSSTWDRNRKYIAK